jgi:hypothetical protein
MLSKRSLVAALAAVLALSACTRHDAPKLVDDAALKAAAADPNSWITIGRDQAAWASPGPTTRIRCAASKRRRSSQTA